VGAAPRAASVGVVAQAAVRRTMVDAGARVEVAVAVEGLSVGGQNG
jgi:hypothetical protein